MICLEQQSPNIADGVHVNRTDDDIGAGDQVQDTTLLCYHNSCTNSTSLATDHWFLITADSRWIFV